MAFSIADIRRGKDPKPPRLLVYGVRGIGKSTFGANAENPIFIPTEDGLDTIDCAKFPRCTKPSEVTEAITTLYSEQHDFKTVVLDSIDWYEKAVHEAVRQTHGAAIFTEYGKGYTFSIPYFSELLEALNALREHRGMTIVLLGHSTIKRFDAPDSPGYDRYLPDLHEKVGTIVEEWCDAVLFTNYKVFVNKEETGFGKSKGKAIGKGDRVLYSEERPAWHAKNRYDLPYEMPLEYPTFLAAVTAGITGEAKPAATKGSGKK